MENRPAILRTMRAWIERNQADAAAGIGISKRTLVDAEAGTVLTEKTWAACAAFYASHGLHWREEDALEHARLIVELD